MRRKMEGEIDGYRVRYPYCIVWTPIPIITWILPFIGHMGICTSVGIIRDFAGPYFVSEDQMGFGNPTKYWLLEPSRVADGQIGWDKAVAEASEEYGGRMHNLFCDNCHSHVAYALNLMGYENNRSWNMVKLCFWMLVYGKYVSLAGLVKTWLPFVLLAAIVTAIVLVVRVY